MSSSKEKTAPETGPSGPTALEANGSFLDEREGTIIGQYKLLQVIGEGGFGVVYMAEQLHPIARRVALKVIKLGMDTRQVVARFEAERQALALMDHPNIARVLDAGATETGRPYFVMELVRGIPITTYCDENRLATEDRLRLFIDVCNAIQHAHQKGIIHRDIKPSNILVTLHDGKPVPKVIDFGIAKATQTPLTDKTLFTRFEQMIGTPAYMSPEQAEMSGLDIDTRSDIYSLGVLLYELLTGDTPFQTRELLQLGVSEMRRRIREEEPLRPSTRISTLRDKERETVAQQRRSNPAALSTLFRRELDWIVLKALEKDRTRRYETANGLRIEVQRYLDGEPVLAVAPTAAYRFRKFAARHKALVASSGAIAVILLVATGISLSQVYRANTASRFAKSERDRAENLRIQAEHARLEESRQREQAVRAKHQAAISSYAAEMNLAFVEYANDNLGAAKELLDRQVPPGPDAEDFRGTEWRLLWKLLQSDEAASLEGRTIHSLEYAPNGRMLAIGGNTSTLLIDSFSRKVLSEIPFKGISVSFGPRSNLLAVANESSVELFDGGSSSALWLNTNLCAPARFSSDGKWLVANSRNGFEILSASDWSARSKTPRGPREVWRYRNALAISPECKTFLAPAGSDFSAKVMPMSIPEGRALYAAPIGTSVSAAIYWTEKLVFLGEWNGTITLWDLSRNLPVKTVSAHKVWISGLKLSPDHKTLYSSSADQTIAAWDAETLTLKHRLRGHRSEIWSLALSPDGNVLVSGSLDEPRGIKFWSTADQSSSGEHPGNNNVIGFCDGGKTLVMMLPRRIELLNMETFQSRFVELSPQAVFDPEFFTYVAIDSVRNKAAIGLTNGAFDWMDLNSGRIIGTSSGDGDAVTALQFSGNRNVLVSGSRSGQLRVWNAENLSLIRAIPAPEASKTDVLSSAAVSNDGSIVVAAQGDFTRIWQGSNPVPAVVRKSVGTVFSVQFSPDESSIAAFCLTPHVIVWDAKTLTIRSELRNFIAGVNDGGFLPDGRSFWTLGKDLKFWNTELLRQTGVMNFKGGWTSRVSPDEKYFAIGYSRGSEEGVTVWRIPTLNEIRRLERETEGTD